MKTVKENVFLISSTPYRDSDLVASFLSSDYGRLTAVIYGGRKIGKKSSFTFNPGDLLEIEFNLQESKDFIKIHNTSAIKLLDIHLFSYQQFLSHTYILEMVSKTTKPGNPSPEVYKLMLEKVSFEWTIESSLVFVGWILWELIQQGGYQIDFSCCSICGIQTCRYSDGNEISFRKASYQLNKNRGQLECHNCQKTTENNITVSSSMIKVFWLYAKMKRQFDVHQRIPNPVMQSVIMLLNKYICLSFEITLKSFPMFSESMESLIKNGS